MSDSFSERMRRRWSARRSGDPQPWGPHGAFGADPANPPPGGPGAAGGPRPGNPFGDPQDGPDAAADGSYAPAAPAAPQESEAAARARMMHERLTEAYAAGDVATVVQIADLVPESAESEPYRTYCRVLAAEAQAQDAAAVDLARTFMSRLHVGHPEWETARNLFGEVTVQALVMGAVPMAGNLPAAEQALAADADYYLHPSGMMLKFDQPEEQHPLLLVLHGNAGKAVREAQRLVREEKKGTPAGHADALCTLALALCAAGDIDAARQALFDAERILPGRPRIQATKTRIEASPAATLRNDG
ncbi:hypothetical protein [Yinghuangia soli]|uniref:Tetratricopeptide repeat protein n=1 Tax=Yinghuangia soli TaxID=2908204 RepID=A0AA41QA17_9ACTN|nr:hypothetical protein [Yinghuangia soli]MCF2532962.1 hypothetical protein [Yinghuangia soli]